MAVKCSVSGTHPERGGGLILAMMFLFLFSVLGTGLLAITTLDIWIGNNYQTAVQLVFVAEAGIDAGLESVQASGLTPSQLLTIAADTDGVLSPSRDSEVLLANPGDRPLIDRHSLADFDSRVAGRYSVFLRNDTADGTASVVDTNDTLTLLSIGEMGQARRVLEAVLARPRLPRFQTGITIGVADPALDLRLRTPARTERLLDVIAANATDTYDPGWAGATVLGGVGSPVDYRVVVVNGDCEFGPGVGYGLLLVRGELTMRGSFGWNGLILAVGQGTVHWPATSYGQISGALFVSRTRADDRGPANLLGSELADPGPALADLAGEGFVEINQEEIHRANRVFRYAQAGYREY
jgi:hypothetical protein